MTTPTFSPRTAAIVGTYLSGKTSLLEEILFSLGAIHKKGSAKDQSLTGDSSPEARARQISTDLNIATTTLFDQEWTFIDCPGSVELWQDSVNALMICDIAVVVCDPDPTKAITVASLLKFLDDHNIPHMLFINKMDAPEASIASVLEALQQVSQRPLVLREIPIRDGGHITGYIDLVSEKAYEWKENAPSQLIKMPSTVQERESSARSEMLETLADFDDRLLEELLEETPPSHEEVYDNLTRDLAKDLIVPVFFGSAEHRHGIARLLKALHYETPSVEQTLERLSLKVSAPAAQIFKTLHTTHTGKQSLCRILAGEFNDGAHLGDAKISGITAHSLNASQKLTKAVAGQVVSLGKLDTLNSGDLLCATGPAPAPHWPKPLAPIYSLALHAGRREDEVKLSGALSKLCEEDSSLSITHNPITAQMVLCGQGDVHLKLTLERLASRFKLEITSDIPKVSYKETIRKSISQHARHKKQSGGHGEFGDITIEIKPLPRGSGFAFSDVITGGVVPKQYISAVEKGVIDALSTGPLGYPVVDVAVVLTDGQYHAVDSSDMAFQKAAQQGIREGLSQCSPVLLEPINHVCFNVPSEFTSKVQRIITARRGQILGFDAREGWNGWDSVTAYIPEAEMHDLIIDLRSQTLGAGSFDWQFDHLQELSGKVADQVAAN